MIRISPIGLLTAIVLIPILITLDGCAPQSRYGMVREEKTGLQYGAVIENNVFIDPSQFGNNSIKVTVRNTSGDTAFDLYNFRNRLASSYAGKGYDINEGPDFGIKVDLNVLRSSQIRDDYTTEFGFLGAAAGAAAGHKADSTGATPIGAVSGLALGSILGSYVVDNTYIIIAEVTIGTLDRRRKKKRITFSDSPKIRDLERDDHTFKPFRRVVNTRIAVFAGGRGVSQSQIAEEVRQRLVKIVSDII